VHVEPLLFVAAETNHPVLSFLGRFLVSMAMAVELLRIVCGVGEGSDAYIALLSVASVASVGEYMMAVKIHIVPHLRGGLKVAGDYQARVTF
jgi:hypothetical protein